MKSEWKQATSVRFYKDTKAALENAADCLDMSRNKLIDACIETGLAPGVFIADLLRKLGADSKLITFCEIHLDTAVDLIQLHGMSADQVKAMTMELK